MAQATPNGAADEVLRILRQSDASSMSTEQIYAASDFFEDRTQLTKAIHYLRTIKKLIDTHVDDQGTRWHHLLPVPIKVVTNTGPSATDPEPIPISQESKPTQRQEPDKPPVVGAPPTAMPHATCACRKNKNLVVGALLEAIVAQADTLNNAVMSSLVKALSAAIEN